MTPRRSFLTAALAVAGLIAAGCSAVETSASDNAGGAGDAVAAGEAAPDVERGGDADVAVSAGETASPPAEADAVDIEQIVMIGDSITVASEPFLTERFAALGYADTVIEAQSSKRIDVGSDGNPSGTAIAARLVDEAEWNGDDVHSDELWVIALGTNDLDQYPDAAGVVDAIDSLLDEVPSDATVVWVDTYFEGRSDATDLVNEVIREQMAWRGDASVAEWSGEAFRDGVLTSDGVHPTDPGAEVFAATVVAAVADVISG